MPRQHHRSIYIKHCSRAASGSFCCLLALLLLASLQLEADTLQSSLNFKLLYSPHYLHTCHSCQLIWHRVRKLWKAMPPAPPSFEVAHGIGDFSPCSGHASSNVAALTWLAISCYHGLCAILFHVVSTVQCEMGRATCGLFSIHYFLRRRSSHQHLCHIPLHEPQIAEAVGKYLEVLTLQNMRGRCGFVICQIFRDFQLLSVQDYDEKEGTKRCITGSR